MATTKKVRMKLKLTVKDPPRASLMQRLYTAELIASAYGEQLHEIGMLLVRQKILTRRAISRDGVRFALANKFEPRRTITISRRTQTLKSAIETWKQ